MCRRFDPGSVHFSFRHRFFAAFRRLFAGWPGDFVKRSRSGKLRLARSWTPRLFAVSRSDIVGWDLSVGSDLRNVDRNGQMKWDASGSYEVPPDALASGRYENLTDSLRHLDSGSYAMPPERSLGSSFSQSGSGEYDFPTELDKHPFRARFGRQAQSLPRRLPRPANPQPPARALPRGRTL